MISYSSYSHLNDWTPLASLFDEFINQGLAASLGADLVTTSPGINLLKTDQAVVIEIALPGINKDDCRIETQEGRLHVSLNRDAPEHVCEVLIREFDYRSFKHTIKLPEHTDPRDITANYEDGVLTIKIVKPSTDQAGWSKSIPIN